VIRLILLKNTAGAVGALYALHLTKVIMSGGVLDVVNCVKFCQNWLREFWCQRGQNSRLRSFLRRWLLILPCWSWCLTVVDCAS